MIHFVVLVTFLIQNLQMYDRQLANICNFISNFDLSILIFFFQGLNLTQNGIPVSVERLENDPWTFEEEAKPVLKYSSELEVQ